MRWSNSALLAALLGDGNGGGGGGALAAAAAAPPRQARPSSSSGDQRRRRRTQSTRTTLLPNYYYASCSGSNRLGQCGFDPLLPTNNPNVVVVAPPKPLDFTTPSIKQSDLVGEINAVAAGEYHTLLLRCDGTVQSLGRNSHNQVGVPTTTSSVYEYTPQTVKLPMAVYKIAAGARTSYFLLRNGTLFGTGDASDGALGLGPPPNATAQSGAAATATTSAEPVWILDGVVDVVSTSGLSGSTTTLVHMYDGSIRAFGDNRYNQLGGAPLLGPIVYSPTEIWHWNTTAHTIQSDGSGGFTYWPLSRTWSNVTRMAVGGRHIALLLEDGVVLTAGSNLRGQLLRPSVPVGSRYDPVLKVAPIAPGSGISNIAAGDEHTVVLLEDGQLLGGGSNAYGQLGTNVQGVDTSDNPAGRYQVATNVAEFGLMAGRGATYYGSKIDGSYWGLGMDAGKVLGSDNSDGGSASGQRVRADGVEHVRAAAVGSAHAIYLAGPPEPEGIGEWSIKFLPDSATYQLLGGNSGVGDNDGDEPEITLPYLVGFSTDYLTVNYFEDDCVTPAPADVISTVSSTSTDNGGSDGIVNLGDSGDGRHEIYEIRTDVDPAAMFTSTLWTPQDTSNPKRQGNFKFCVRVDGWLQAENGADDIAVVYRKQIIDLNFDSTKVTIVFGVNVGDGGGSRRRQQRGRGLQGPAKDPLRGLNGGELGELCPLDLELVEPTPEEEDEVDEVAPKSGGTRPTTFFSADWTTTSSYCALVWATMMAAATTVALAL